MRPRFLPVMIVFLCPLATALPQKDQALLDKALLKGVRPMAFQTVLVKDGRAVSAIVAPSTLDWQRLAQTLQHGITQITGTNLPIISGGSLTEADWCGKNYIILGNLAVCPEFARLYHNFFVCSDAGYTGTEGFELRSVHEPFGPECNVIAVGAQTPTGVARGIAELLDLCSTHGVQGQLTLPRISVLDLQHEGARAPVPPRLTESQIDYNKAYYDRIYSRPGTERAAAHRVVKDAMRYHRTGDEGYVQSYRYGMLRHIRYYEENDYINAEGLARYDRDFRDSWTWGFVVSWDLLEEHPCWTDEERLKITNHVLRCVIECNAYQRWMSPEAVERWRTFDSITHNHHTWPGLANLFGGWYFKRHYQHPMADNWLTIAYGMFGGCKHSSKPWEDSAGYQWIPMGHVFTYSSAAGDTTYMDEGHAAETGKVALMCLDSLGHEPAFGDHSSFSGHSRLPEMFSALEYATGDGRYRWALDWLGADSRGELEEAYFTAVSPEFPTDHIGIVVSYLPRRHYDLNGMNPQYFPTANIPFEESFDKMSLRAGWEHDDDYLLLDGYSGGSHGHQDCNAIIGYTAAGAHWLVDGEYIRQTPKYHCAVTIVRDGTSVRNPAMARLDTAAWYGDAGICQTTIPDYNGLKWTRTIYWRPNRFVVVRDDLAANQAGDYALRCCWRTFGRAELEGNILTLTQQDARFSLASLAGGIQELVHIKDVGQLPVHHLYQRKSLRMAEGDSVCFVNAFAARKEGSPMIEAYPGPEDSAIIRDSNMTTILGKKTFECSGLRADASAWMSDESRVRLTGLSTLTVNGQSVDKGESSTQMIDLKENTRVTGIWRKTPCNGQRPVIALETGAQAPLALQTQPLEHYLVPSSTEQTASSAPDTNIENQDILWTYDDFPIAPKSLPVKAVSSVPAPREKYSPIERLADGQYSSSVGSCMFPEGSPVSIDIDLGETRQLSEIRIRAWEMVDTWHTQNRRVLIKDARKDAEWQPLPGEPTVVGTQRWGNNVNTIYAISAHCEARYIRVEAAPANDLCSVYFAEIEAAGCELGQAPELVKCVSADLNGDGRSEAVIATRAGQLVALSTSGEPLWRVDVEAEITALASGHLDASGNDWVTYGAAQELLGTISPDGKKTKEIQIPAYRGIHSEPQTIAVADLNGDGTQSIVVGVKSWQYLAYTSTLEQLWNNVIYAHSATVGKVVDLDGDGKKETIAGNAYYRLNILAADGKRQCLAGRFGPEQTAVASGDLDGDGLHEVMVGTDGGDILVFKLNGDEVWQCNVGDRIATLLVGEHDGKTAVVAASESGYVCQYSPTGEPLWQTNLGSPVRKLYEHDGVYVCVASEKGIVLLGTDGKISRQFSTPSPAMDLCISDGCFIAMLRGGIVCGVKNQD